MTWKNSDALAPALVNIPSGTIDAVFYFASVPNPFLVLVSISCPQ